LMGWKVKVRNLEPNAGARDEESHPVGHLAHSRPEVLAVLASDVVGENQVENEKIEQRRSENKIHIGVPEKS
jgi:hypothetical protein